ncbi:MAG: hypothetical protein AMDU3_IPLC00004G0429 [Thermoplasmatales archaeon I-plasma]|nr:MAG: hypothetical protein AMDU3_IPLC00004G0429 [Thermoplasmatales archaeon I-plasma]
MINGDEEKRRYGILISLLSRGKIEDAVTPAEVLEDSNVLCSHPEVHICPGFESFEDVIATARSTPHFWYSERGLIHIEEHEDKKQLFREFSVKIEGTRHFNFVFVTCLSLAKEFQDKGYHPPLIVPTNRLNAGSLYPLKGKKSVEPDAIVITRDELSTAEFGHYRTAAVEVQLSGFDFLYAKLRKYRELLLTGEKLFILIIIPDRLGGDVDAFVKKVQLMGFIENVNYRVQISGRTGPGNNIKFQNSASSVQ